jgi:hypothetical protein
MSAASHRPAQPPTLIAAAFWTALTRWCARQSRGSVVLPTGYHDPSEVQKVVLAIIRIQELRPAQGEGWTGRDNGPELAEPRFQPTKTVQEQSNV